MIIYISETESNRVFYKAPLKYDRFSKTTNCLVDLFYNNLLK